jgi:hypothetical protein
MLRVALEARDWLSESAFTDMKGIQIIADAEGKVVRSNESNSYHHYKRKNNRRTNIEIIPFLNCLQI